MIKDSLLALSYSEQNKQWNYDILDTLIQSENNNLKIQLKIIITPFIRVFNSVTWRTQSEKTIFKN